MALMVPALAQAPAGSGFDAHGFRLAAHDADLRDPLVVQRPGALEAGSAFVGGLLEYAAQPLVFRTPTGTVTELDDLVVANLSAGYAPVRTLRLDVFLPLHLYGEDRSGGFVGFGVGDVRATALMQLVEPGSTGLGTAVVAHLDLPTGRPGVWLGQTTVAGGIGLALTQEFERLTLGASAGSQLRPNTRPEERPAPTKGGDAFAWGISVGYLVGERGGLTAEIHGEVAIEDDVRAAVGVPVEALLSMRRVEPSGAFLTAGIGAGLTRGAGAAPLRLVLGGGFGAKPGPADMDGDGIGDYEDACPATPEVVNGFLDEDGCRDTVPHLRVRALLPDGTPAEDATLVVKGPGHRAEGRGELGVRSELLGPDTVWEAEARVGACLRGAASVQVPSSGGELDLWVPLEIHRDGRLLVEVFGPDGASVPGATVQFRSEDPACSPSRFEGISEGIGQVELGPGTHFAFIVAEGYAIHQTSFTMEPGEERTIRVTLQPALAQLETDAMTGDSVIRIKEKVFFDTGEATIQERSFPLLDQVASVILAHGVRRLEVAGHTDAKGDAEANRQLSQARAEAVRAYLIEHGGVDPDVLVARGYGEEQPIADNRTPAGRAANRRVEFRVLGEGDAP